MKTFLSLALVVASVSAAAGADLTGKWTGTLETTGPDGASRSGPAFVILKQEGSTVTGSGGPGESEQHPIRNGKLEGDRLTFEIETGNGNVMRFDLKVSGDRIEGDVRGESPSGEKRSAKLSVGRGAEK